MQSTQNKKSGKGDEKYIVDVNLSKSRQSEPTSKTTLNLFKEGMTLQEIALARNLTIGTVRSHMTSWIKSGDVHLEQLMSKERIETLYKHFLYNEDEKKLSALKSKIPIGTDWYELRWIRAYHDWISQLK